MSVLPANFQNCVCVCGNQSSEVSPLVKKSHIPVDPHIRHATLTYAGNVTADRECGIVKGFGAGGWQLFALLIFDLT